MNQNPLTTWLDNEFIGHNAIILNDVESTNDYAKQLLSTNPPNGTVIISKMQNNGRGQKANSWVSPVGGLYYSCILNLNIHERLTMLTLACGAACHEAIDELTTLNANLKWINDIEFNNKKVAGILLESKARADKATVIIGVGINVNTNLEELPPEIREKTTSLQKETSKQFNILQLAALVSNYLEEYLHTFEDENYNLIKSLWIQKSRTLGRRIQFGPEDQRLEGVVIDINTYGALIVQGIGTKQYKLTSNVGVVYL